MTKKSVNLYTDGACLGNPGPGGWAALLQFGTREKLVSGGEPQTTNNRMELLAIINGLKHLNQSCQITIYTDSQYVLNAFEKGWLAKWQSNGWRTSQKEPVKNQDLWEELESQVQTHKVTWRWVKGHSGHPENERVDEAAREEAKKLTLT